MPLTTMEEMKRRKYRIGIILGLMCILLAAFRGSTLKRGQIFIVSGRKLQSPSPSFVTAADASDQPSPITRKTQSLLRKNPASPGGPSNSLISREQPGRRLPGEYDFGDPAAMGSAVLLLILLFLLCCCRGALCDLLACVCLYEMCCDDGVVGGFDLMPL